MRCREVARRVEWEGERVNPPVRLNIEEMRERAKRLRSFLRENAESLAVISDFQDIVEEMERLYRDVERMQVELEAWRP